MRRTEDGVALSILLENFQSVLAVSDPAVAERLFRACLDLIEAVIQSYLQLRRDPYASHFNQTSFGAKADPRYLSCRKCLREKISPLGPPAGPSTVRLPLPVSLSKRATNNLPLATDAGACGVSDLEAAGPTQESAAAE